MTRVWGALALLAACWGCGGQDEGSRDDGGGDRVADTDGTGDRSDATADADADVPPTEDGQVDGEPDVEDVEDTPAEVEAEAGADADVPEEADAEAESDAPEEADAEADGDVPLVCTAHDPNCGGPDHPCAPGDQCVTLYTGPGSRNWPVVCDATGPAMPDGRPGCTCASPAGVWPSMGMGAATWFDFADCGTFKEFGVSAGCRFVIVSYTDCCPGCVLQHISYDIQEDADGDGSWETETSIEYPSTTGTCQVHTDSYAPRTNRVRFVNTGAFYICVYEE